MTIAYVKLKRNLQQIILTKTQLNSKYITKFKFLTAYLAAKQMASLLSRTANW